MIHEAPANLQPVRREAVNVPLGSLAEWEAAWHRAARATPDAVRESFCEFGGKPVRLRVVGAQLAHHVRRAFAHLERDDCGSATRALRIDLWDESDTGVPPPRDIARDPAALTAPIGSGVATICEGGRLIGYERSTSITWLDRAAGHMIGWRASGERLPVDERSKPIPVVLRIWYYDQDIDVIHAGLVAKGGSGALLGGQTGAGKSTTALSCLAAGFDYLGDDEIGLERCADGSFIGHSLYNSLRPPRALLGEPPVHCAAASALETEKPLLFVTELEPQRVRRRVPLCALVLPRIAATPESRLQPLSRGEALVRLSATALFTPLGLGTRAVDRLAQLIASVRFSSLELGRDAASIHRCVEQALSEASG